MRVYKSETYDYVCPGCLATAKAVQETRFELANRNFACRDRPKRLAVCTFVRLREEAPGVVFTNADGDKT